MNTYIFTLPPSGEIKGFDAGEMIDSVLPTRVSGVYQHFALKTGMLGCPHPMGLSWWPNAEFKDSALVILPWNVKNRIDTNGRLWAAQLKANAQTAKEQIELLNKLKDLGPADGPDRKAVDRAALLLETIRRYGGQVSYTYSAMSDKYGACSLVGYQINEDFRQWVLNSVKAVA